jgi:hypothetical protein
MSGVGWKMEAETSKAPRAGSSILCRNSPATADFVVRDRRIARESLILPEFSLPTTRHFPLFFFFVWREPLIQDRHILFAGHGSLGTLCTTHLIGWRAYCCRSYAVELRASAFKLIPSSRFSSGLWGITCPACFQVSATLKATERAGNLVISDH